MTVTARSEIQTFLSEWANTKNSPHFAVLIEGEWGCGKTHFVNSLLESKTFKTQKSIYVSLFGIPDIEALNTQLFYASASTASKYAHRGLGVASSLVKGTLRLDLDGDNQTGATVDGTLGGITGVIEKANRNLDGALLILDDLERCPISMVELLGVINTLIEHGDTRVLLVANTDKIKDTAFESFNEKIVGQRFLLASDPSAALTAFIEEISDEGVQELLKRNSEKILELYDTSTYHNLRSLRQFVWQLAALISKLEPQHRGHSDLISELIFQYFIFFIEFKLSLSDEEVAVKISDLSGTNDAEDGSTRYINDMGGFFGEKKKASAKQKILEKYDVSNGIDSVVTIRQWISILKTGVIDADCLNTEIAKADILIGTDDWPSWKRLRHFYNWDFSDGSQDKFDSDLADLNQKLDNGDYKHPKVFLHVAALLIRFSENGIHSATVDETMGRLKTYVADQLIPNMTYEVFRSVQYSFDSGYDGLGFLGSDGTQFISIQEDVISKLDAWHEDWKQGDVAEHLINLLKTDLTRFLGNLVVINNSPEQRFLQEPILHVIDPQAFVDTWLAMARKDERLLASCLKSRYEYTATLLEQEGPWWKEVRRKLLTRKDAESFIPRQVQIQELVEDIDSALLSLYVPNEKPE